MCSRCGSSRVLRVTGKVADLCTMALLAESRTGEVDPSLGVGSGDYLRFRVCLDCGQMQGTWPRPPTLLEMSKDEDS